MIHLVFKFVYDNVCTTSGKRVNRRRLLVGMVNDDIVVALPYHNTGYQLHPYLNTMFLKKVFSKTVHGSVRSLRRTCPTKTHARHGATKTVATPELHGEHNKYNNAFSPTYSEKNLFVKGNLIISKNSLR